MLRKRLAVVLSQADSTYQKNLLKGLVSEAFRYDFDVCVFTAFIKEGTPAEYQTGEANIYHLLDFEKFDGVILVPDTIKFSGINERIISELKDRSLPVVTIDYQLDDFPCVWGSDSDDIEKLVDHIIDVHDCRIIDFFSGPKNHPHSLHREEGYIRSLKKHGIPYEPERIHYGDFTDNKSEDAADEILRSGRPLPQGIACVSDISAGTLANALIARGYRVPEDFRIVGYDTTVSSRSAVGDVTTMIRNSGYAGIKAIRYMYRAICGEEPAGDIDYKFNDIITSASCGCGIARNKADYSRSLASDNIYELVETFYSGYNFMMEDLIAVDSYEEFFWRLSWYVKEYINDPDAMYICACDDWQAINEEEESRYRTIGYPDIMTQVFVKNSDGHIVDIHNTFATKLMLPQLYKEADKPSVYYFTPWHFNDRCFGYTVLQYVNRPEVFNNEYASWMRNADNAFEALRRRLKMKSLYENQERLRAFSVTDSLTGIYNRNGYNSIAVEMFESAKKENNGFFMLVGDMNNLKTINDTYGHIEGDESIKATAQAMKSACDKDEKCFRIGGDEFVIIGTGEYTKEYFNTKIQKVEEFLSDYNQRSAKAYKISISLGCEYASADSFDSIKDALASADKKMFANKQRYKSQNN